jgi:hypothetical protein
MLLLLADRIVPPKEMSQSQQIQIRQEGVDFEPLLAEDEEAEGTSANLSDAGRFLEVPEAGQVHEEECNPVARSFLRPMLGRNNLNALSACALFAVCSNVHMTSSLHLIRM